MCVKWSGRMYGVSVCVFCVVRWKKLHIVAPKIVLVGRVRYEILLFCLDCVTSASRIMRFAIGLRWRTAIWSRDVRCSHVVSHSHSIDCAQLLLIEMHRELNAGCLAAMHTPHSYVAIEVDKCLLQFFSSTSMILEWELSNEQRPY